MLAPALPPPPPPRTRIPVPTHSVDAVAAVDRIAENMAVTLSLSDNRTKPVAPPSSPVSSGATMIQPEEISSSHYYQQQPQPPPKPPRPPRPAAAARPGAAGGGGGGGGARHASPAAEAALSARDAGGAMGDKPFAVSAVTRRKSEMTNIFFLEHYFDLLKYLDDRKARLQRFKQESQGTSPDDQIRGWKKHCQAETDKLRRRRCRPRIANFCIIKQVGQGGYGQVFLARQNDTKEICALKKMSKSLLLNLGEINHILTERDILTRTSTPWLVKLLYSFQDTDHVFLAMEYVPGGDMRTLLNNSGVLRECHARFYVAEMAVAVAELHALGFIHRDLKPENFLIDVGGHLKLTDFGLSRGWVSQKVVDGLKIKLDKIKMTVPTKRSTYERRSIHQSIRREDMLAYSLVGSPDYMAPEVLTNNQEGYGLEVDYWSIGCILFECLAGYPPFTAPTTDDVWVNVYNWSKVLERPHYTGADEEFNLTDTAWSLVTALLASRDTRLRTPNALQSHRFFAPLSFSRLRTPAGAAPPFVPTLPTETDTSYFDDFSDENDMAMYKEVRERMRDVAGKNVKGGNGVDKARDKEIRDAFVGFTFRHAGWEDAVGSAHGRGKEVSV
ncbi:hypothetical protein HDU86_006105 [Geranomyces michiganensis]|nr:hypothetical protein HDU86_006105 [Geranomyces michiganensis]